VSHLCTGEKRAASICTLLKRPNRHLKELLYCFKNKRRIRKKDREEQRFRHKKIKEGDKNDLKSGKHVKVEHWRQSANEKINGYYLQHKWLVEKARPIWSSISRVSRTVIHFDIEIIHHSNFNKKKGSWIGVALILIGAILLRYCNPLVIYADRITFYKK
jgi:hypothetical protein